MTLRETGLTWGVATAAFQIEGSPTADGKGQSIWDTFSHTPGKIAEGATADVATDSYRRYRDDIALVRDLGFDAYRFSISWPRIQPDGGPRRNQAGIDHYRRVIEACLEAGVEPWVTLYHWDLPQALEDHGGWTSRDTAYRFADYAELMGQEYGDVVRHWMLFNEPLNTVISGYLVGNFAPGRQSLLAYFAALHHINLATGIGSRALRAADPDGVIGTTQYLTPPVGRGPWPLSSVAERAADAVLNRAFLEPIIGRGYPWRDAQILLGVRRWMRDTDEQDMVADLDFLGVQYYTRLQAPFLPIPGLWTVPMFGRGGPTTSTGWQIMPEGLGMVLDRVHAYGVFDRIVVTEGGASFEDRLVDGRVHDAQRIEYYQTHIGQVLAARERGVPVDGYFAWSLMDNFEWALGYGPRFGLVHVDYDSQQRTVKDSGYWFADELGGSAKPVI
jgi:beta-glucosidase